jgi:hypothetical protein
MKICHIELALSWNNFKSILNIKIWKSIIYVTKKSNWIPLKYLNTYQIFINKIVKTLSIM